MGIEPEPTDGSKHKFGLGDAILYLVIGTALTFFFKGPIENVVGSFTDRPIEQAVQWLGLEQTEPTLPSLQNSRSQPQSGEAQ